VAGAENIANFNEQNRCPYIKTMKIIFHPGEVNKIRELPQFPTIVVTHTDAAELYVWATDKQPDRSQDPVSPSPFQSITHTAIECPPAPLYCAHPFC
jgi:histone-binding protein RBBP4